MSTNLQNSDPQSGMASQSINDNKRCAHQDCLCEVREGQLYCSEYCQSTAKLKSTDEAARTSCLCADEECLKECDLIMKGGITSGIVYPSLVVKLARKYRFRSVGGTSAGAIAAAVTAAAEYGRQLRGESGKQVFERLTQVRDWLSNGTNLRKLFQPSPSTRPLLELFLNLAAQTKDKARGIRNVLRTLRDALKKADRETFMRGSKEWRLKGFMLGLGIALLLAVLSFLTLLLLASAGVGGAPSWSGLLLLFLLFGILFALPLSLAGRLFGGLVSSGKNLFQIVTKEVKDNLFGICDGQSGESSEVPPLTTWLHRTINYLAAPASNGSTPAFKDCVKGSSFDGPGLTFEKLWGTEDPKAERKIDLRMVTSNLSQSQPYVLPFDDSNLFLFAESEFKKLFPDEVVKQMSKVNEKAGYTAPSGYHFLPEAKDFPVIVVTRMSLSFPVLLSAVPLYTIKYGRSGKLKADDLQEKSDVQKNWFSDGGICSNFPIHFFDAWLPSRPTFGVNLTSLPQDQMVENSKPSASQEVTSKQEVNDDKEKVRKQEVKLDSYSVSSSSSTLELSDKGIHEMNKAVFLPQPDKQLPPLWVDIPSLPRFMGEVFRIAQNYRDNMQAMLPSYRERIVQIALSDKEGGLNLEMPDEVIKEVVNKGEIAGEKLLEYFRFDQHQWVRFRVLMREMEKSLDALHKVMTSTRPKPPGFDSAQLLDRQLADQFPFHCDAEWVAKVRERLEGINALLKCWEEPRNLFAKDPNPLPEPVLRVGPEI